MLNKYWFLIRAKYKKPQEGQRRGAARFYRNFGVTASSQKDALSLIEPFIAEDGGVLEEAEEMIEGIELEDLHEDVRKQIGNTEERGVWYQSGQMQHDGDLEEDGED